MEGQATINLATSEEIEEEIGRNKTDEEKLECPRHEATSMEGDKHVVYFQAFCSPIEAIKLPECNQQIICLSKLRNPVSSALSLAWYEWTKHKGGLGKP